MPPPSSPSLASGDSLIDRQACDAADGRGCVDPTGATGLAPRRIASDELFAGAVEVQIEHREQVYRLRRTSLGKLILTK
mgnify:CR=1 FL=1